MVNVFVVLLLMPIIEVTVLVVFAIKEFAVTVFEVAFTVRVLAPTVRIFEVILNVKFDVPPNAELLLNWSCVFDPPGGVEDIAEVLIVNDMLDCNVPFATAETFTEAVLLKFKLAVLAITTVPFAKTP